MIVITNGQIFGIYQTVEILADRLLCNGEFELLFASIGAYSISEDDSLMVTSTAVLPVPEEISPRQIRRALSQFGLRDIVENSVKLGDQELKDWWEWSTSFLRHHPLVISMAEQLGVSNDQLDSLWRLGATL